jgi:hypothetical protein
MNSLILIRVGIFDLRLSPQMPGNPAPSTREHYCHSSLQTYDTNKRYDPFKAHEVYGYPSTGGVLIKGVCAVELLHLNLDKFKKANRSLDPAEEDEFCKRLRSLGARWWLSEGHHVDMMIGEGDLEKEAKVVQTGWPSSGNGVWVLKYNAKDLNARLRVQLLKLASNMDERCQVIKELGGSFFEDPGACEDLRFDMLSSVAK